MDSRRRADHDPFLRRSLRHHDQSHQGRRVDMSSVPERVSAFQKRERLVALHQPNFFPWLGYFDKLVRADVFVVLDNVQCSKTGGTWSNRVRLLGGDAPRWITMPVVRAYSGVRLVREMQIDNEQPWRRKFLQTLRTYYA